MTNSTVIVRGKSYKINPFSDCHIATLSNLLKDTSNLQYQFDAGFILKEIILPDLPYDVIRETNKGKYIFMIHAREIADLLMKVLRYYYESEIDRTTSEGDKELAEQFKTNLAELGKEELKDAKSDRIAELKAKLKEAEESKEIVLEANDVRHQQEEEAKDKHIAELEARLAARA